MYPFIKSVVGGTFDNFHKGHEHLLSAAFAESKHVVIGITTTQLHQNKLFASSLQSYEIRRKIVESFLQKHKFDLHASIIPISDVYGTTLTDKDIQAIFITEENISAVEKINTERHKRGFSTLEAIIVPYVTGPSEIVISSEAIRRGIIDREGKSFVQVFAKSKIFRLPEELRSELRNPIGTLFHDIDDLIPYIAKSPCVIAVGDVVASSLQAKKQQASLSIIDFKTRRHTQFTQSESLITSSSAGEAVNNKAGNIDQQAAIRIHEMLTVFFKSQEKQVLIVEGEEDLLTIPAILLAPLATLVVYGQFEKGIVLVEVTPEKKQEILTLLKRFN